MVDVVAIRSVRYACDLSGSTDISSVLAPPYDVIDASLRQKLVSGHPHNTVAVDLPVGGPDRYTKAGELYRSWLRDGVLVCDDEPCITIVHQRFRGPDGFEHIRKGIIAGVGLESFGGKILPHEYTLKGPKEDRLNLFRSCAATASQVFCVYDDPQQLLERWLAPIVAEPPMQVAHTGDGVTQHIWWTSQSEIASKITDFFADKTVLIADGHHRYETHLHYLEEQQKVHGKKDVPARHVAMYLANIADPGTAVYPIHRLVRDVPNWAPDDFRTALERDFRVTPCMYGLESVKAKLIEESGVFGVMTPDCSAYILSVGDRTPLEQLTVKEPLRSFDVAVVHGLVFDRILGIDAAKLAEQAHVDYIKAEADVMPKLASGRYQFGCILPPPDPRQVAKVAAAGQRMPQKSTFFFPKIQSGVVFSPLD